jgi:cell division protein FtsL
MSQTAPSEAMDQIRPVKEKSSTSAGAKYSTFILATLILTIVALLYVGSHIRMTRIEYEIAAALSAKELLLEEQKKLKLEMAMLKSPHRIEQIAKAKLQMSYPDAEQVIVIKQTGK